VTIKFFRDFYRSDASHIRTDRYKANMANMAAYSAGGEQLGPLLVGYCTALHCTALHCTVLHC
jgi:hypothetical protein